MDKCINTKHPEFIKLAKQANINPLILKSKVGVWQEKNNSDEFPTLQELGIKHRNSEIKEGVSELFESNPELANIGSQQRYSQYLDTIFPYSKVKDIVYHNTKEQFETFDKSKLISDGFYFTPDNKAYKHAGEIKMSVLLDLKNPITDAPGLSETINKPGDAKRFSDLGHDGIIDLDGLNEYIAFEPEQIHILSSKKDLEMFKNFINFTKSDYVKYGDIQQFRDYIISKNFAAIEEFLVVNNKIDRKC